MPARPVHPSVAALAEFGLGRLAEPDAGTIAAHLETCPDCRRRAADVPADDFLRRIRDAQGRGTTPGPDLPLTGLAAAVSPPARILPELADHPQYEIVRELGRGGMGVVYLARNKLMDRQEVLKVVSRELLTREGAAERFLREIRSAAKLNHPNVVAALAAIQSGNLIALAMEHVPGEDLGKLVKTHGPLPIADACEYAFQAALGLQHAYEKGMVHRDIKPANLMLVRDGATALVKVLDFGLAKATSEKTTASGAPAPTKETALTAAGRMLGTPEYMAPEQIRDAASADIRADVYSLGCTLYHLIAGRPPFTASNLYSLLGAHQNAAPDPLTTVRPDAPLVLAAVVSKMLAKAPADRYQSPREVAAALLPFARPPARRSRWQFAAAVALLVVALVGAWAAGLFRVKTADGTLVVDVGEPNADVFIDGERVAVTGADGKTIEITRAPGTHKVQVTKDGFTAVGEVVTLRSGKNPILEAKLVPVAKPEAAPPGPPVSLAPPVPAPEPGPTAEPKQPQRKGIPNYIPASLGALAGDWRIEDGDLVQRSLTHPRAFLFFGDADWTDYDLELEGQRVEGPEGFKVVFRAPDSHNFHTLGLGSYGNKFHEAFRVVDRVWHRDVPVKAGVQETDHWYKVRVEVRGAKVRCALDGNPLFDYTDAHFPKGRVGLGTANTAARFRNIKVTSADGKVLWDKLPDLPKADPPIPKTGRKAEVFGDPGFWRVADGELLFGHGAIRNTWILFGDADWGDYDFQVRLLREESGHSGASLLFRATGPGNDNLAEFIRGMGGNRYGGIEYNFPGRIWARDINGRDLPHDEGPNGRFDSEKWYSHKVEVRGATSKCYMDGELRYQFDGIPSARGRVGLRTVFSVFRFRDLRVTKPDGTVIWSGLPDLPPSPVPVPAAYAEPRPAPPPADK
jgi:tRNA A-37 threonylcarbamoyl transferase component Bud32